MAKKGGLGRGLDILFQDTGAAGGDEGVSTLRLAEIEPDKNQPRKAFDDTALSELAASITEHGVLQPIVVRPVPRRGIYHCSGRTPLACCAPGGPDGDPCIDQGYLGHTGHGDCSH